jgi:hypothetical protein
MTAVPIRLAERTRRRPTSIAGKVVTGGSASDSKSSRLALLFRAARFTAGGRKSEAHTRAPDAQNFLALART